MSDSTLNQGFVLKINEVVFTSVGKKKQELKNEHWFQESRSSNNAPFAWIISFTVWLPQLPQHPQWCIIPAGDAQALSMCYTVDEPLVQLGRSLLTKFLIQAQWRPFCLSVCLTTFPSESFACLVDCASSQRSMIYCTISIPHLLI